MLILRLVANLLVNMRFLISHMQIERALFIYACMIRNLLSNTKARISERYSYVKMLISFLHNYLKVVYSGDIQKISLSYLDSSRKHTRTTKALQKLLYMSS